MLTGYYENYSKLFIFFVCSCPSSSVQGQITVLIPFWIIYLHIWFSLHWRLWDLSCQWACIPLIICVHWHSCQLWVLTHSSKIQYFLRIPSLRIVCGTSYLLKNFIRQRVCFCVAFGWLISCITTGFNWFWFLPPGYLFLSFKVSVCHPCSFDL